MLEGEGGQLAGLTQTLLSIHLRHEGEGGVTGEGEGESEAEASSEASRC